MSETIARVDRDILGIVYLYSALLVAMLGTGCVYPYSINEAPSASVEVAKAPDPLYKGFPVRLVATMSDPEDGVRLRSLWSVKQQASVLVPTSVATALAGVG